MEINQKQRRLIFIISGLVGLAVILLIAGSLVNRSSVAPLLNRLVATQAETLRLNELAQKLSPDLATSRVQANVAAIITSDLADLEAERLDITTLAKLPEDVTAAVTNLTAADELDAAAQRGSLAAEYERLVGDSLQASLDLTAQLQRETKQKSLLSLLERISEHLQTLESQVTEL